MTNDRRVVPGGVEHFPKPVSIRGRITDLRFAMAQAAKDAHHERVWAGYVLVHPVALAAVLDELERLLPPDHAPPA